MTAVNITIFVVMGLVVIGLIVFGIKFVMRGLKEMKKKP